MIKLTARQQQVLDLIFKTIQDTGMPPTRAEIAKGLGFKSANAAEDHLKALAKKGAISLSAGTSRGIKINPSLYPQDNIEPRLELPIIGRVAAGNPVLAEENIEKNLQVDLHLFTSKPDYLLRVKGESMKDIGILEGDLLAVKKTEIAHNGQIIVARIQDEVTVKRFHKSATGIQLLPENPDFSPIIINPHEPFAIEGLAVGLIRQF